MIVSRTPLRMSFVGGGSDIPSFYRIHGGAVLSTTIDKYVYINVNKKFDDGIRLSYSKTENVNSLIEIEHKIVRETLYSLNINKGIEITSIADIPSKGTGLGSSSSFTVGLIHALKTYLGETPNPSDLGKLSCEIEIIKCNEPIGKQDQYAAAYGGMNLIVFDKDDSVRVIPANLSSNSLQELEDNILLFYTGITRSASQLLNKQNEDVVNSDLKQNTLIKMAHFAYEIHKELQNNNLSSFGEVLHENWILKKSLTNGISNNFIDNCYKEALDAGAKGGKILGAGAGGFLMIYANKNKQKKIINRLNNLRKIDFKFDRIGSTILYK